jgi:cytochrome c oxidase assembly protein subunit 15
MATRFTPRTQWCAESCQSESTARRVSAQSIPIQAVSGRDLERPDLPGPGRRLTLTTVTAETAAPGSSTPGPADPGDFALWRLGSRGRAILLTNVVAEIGIVVTGGLVRLTGSGLGCPTWPECTAGSIVPVARQSEGVHKYIEFGNRMLTFAVLVTAIAALVVVLRPALARRFGRLWGDPGHPRGSLIWLAVGGLVGIVGQAALGGVTVLLDLHPATVASHFMLSMVMIALAFLLYRRAQDCADHPVNVIVRRELRVVAKLLTVVAIAVLVLGTVVTGTGPHSGDAVKAVRFGLDPRTVSWLHSDLVLVFVGLTFAYTLGAHLTGARKEVVRGGYLLLAACVLQGVIGYLQFFTGLPVGLVSVHVLGACLVWVATLNVLVGTRTRGREALAN